MWWKYYKIPAVILLIGFICTLVMVRYLQQKEVAGALLQLSNDADEYSASLTAETERSLALLATLKSFFATGDIDRKVFFTIANDALSRYHQVRDVMWIPFVEHEQREQLEATGKYYISDFEIRTMRDGELVRADDRPYYYPIFYQASSEGSISGLGIDLASNFLLDNLNRVRDQGGENFAVEMLPAFGQSISGGADREHFLVAIMPVYSGNPQSVEDRRKQFKGFLLGSIRVQALLDTFMTNQRNQHINMLVLDETSDDRIIIVNMYDDKTSAELDDYEYTDEITTIRNRSWSLSAIPTERYFELVMDREWLYARWGGMLFTVLIAAYAHNLGSRTREVEELVTERTLELSRANDKLEQLSRTDALTQIANRRYFDEYLEAEWFRSQRDGRVLSLILCDVDFFKAYNDHYGHVEGDICLQRIALALRSCFGRSADLVARYGGEEFAAILPATALDDDSVMRRCNDVILAEAIPHDKSEISDFVTISLGACTLIPTETIGIADIIRAADKALYRAKSEGRNRAVKFNFEQGKGGAGVASTVE